MNLQFIQYVKDECKNVGVKVILGKGKNIKWSATEKCSGYFDSEGKKLACATGWDDWIETLVHEFAHFTQWQENTAIWRICNELNSTTLVDDWLEGTEVNDIKKHIGIVRDMELDNEKRTVELIRKFQLDIDIELYIKRANAYIYFHNWMKETRRWMKPPNTPYRSQKLTDAMPNHFNNNYNVLPAKLRAIYKSENI